MSDFANMPIKEWARQYAAEGGEPFHAVLCDAPYEIAFMNKGWDNSGVAFDVATWQAVYEVLHPGAFMFVFGGSRTFHRMAVAIEDAGFVMHPTVVWINGESFPKATRIADAPEFEGHRYGRQALKGCAEYIIKARKPLTDCSENDKMVIETEILMEAFLCQFINAQVAGQSLSDASNRLKEAKLNTVRSSAFLIQYALSQLQDCKQADMWRLSGAESTLLNIVSLWNNIWDASSKVGNTYTTSMETKAITTLKILKSWLLLNTPDYIVQGVLNPSGSSPSVNTAEKNLIGKSEKSNSTQTHFVHGSASDHTGKRTGQKNANNAAGNSIPLRKNGVIALVNVLQSQSVNQEALIERVKSAETIFISLAGTLKTSAPTFAENAKDNPVTNKFILCAQRPYEGRPVDNIVATGAGALNIEKGRTPIASDDPELGRLTDPGEPGGGVPLQSERERYAIDNARLDSARHNANGRWPANVVLSHAPDCTPSHCGEGCAVMELGEQSGEGLGGHSGTKGQPKINGMFMTGQNRTDFMQYDDSGTASRFFFNADYYLEVAEQIESAAPMMYTPKADRWQREAGLFGEAEQVRTTYDKSVRDSHGNDSGHPRRNTHSTVKPLALTHWLASLLLPPDEYAPRRLLVPFSGVASECIGAMLAGWDHVQGVEIEAEYIDIAKQRVEFWQQYAGMNYETARRYAEVKQAELERAARMNAPVDDLPLFANGVAND